MSAKRPPLGVRLTVDIEEVRARRGTVWWARVRWHDPESGRRESIKRSHSTHEAAATWITQMQNASRTGVDATQTLAEYVTFIGDRWTRGIDPTSTYDPYSAGLRRRVLPTLGHLPVAMITAGRGSTAPSTSGRPSTGGRRARTRSPPWSCCSTRRSATASSLATRHGPSPSPHGRPFFRQLRTEHTP